MIKFRKKIFFVLSILFLTGFTDDYHLETSIPVNKVDFFSSDNLDNIYVLGQGILNKYDPSGKFLCSFSEKRYGTPYFIDVTNPLKVLVFFRDFGIISVLDNKLSLKTEINLKDAGIYQAGIVSNSYNDAFWVYDQQEMKLKRLDQNLKLLNESQVLSQLISEPLNPTGLSESNNLLLLNNPNSGILVFDVYGTYIRTIGRKGVKNFQVVNDQLLQFYYEKGKPRLESFNLKTNINSNILLPFVAETDSIIEARIGRQKLFLFKKEIIDLYSF